MSNFKIQDIIRYADQQMDAAERAAFEQTLKDDTALQADLKLYQGVNSTLKIKFSPSKADEDLKSNLKDFTNQYFKSASEKPKTKIFTMQKLWYAAAILIIGLWIWAPWNTNLYTKYSETKMVSFTERGNDSNADLQKATDAFNAKKYQEVKDILNPLVKEKPENDMLRFYLAVADLETNNIKTARENLIKVYAKESLFKYDAALYMALSYLKEENKAKCKEWLTKIPADATEYTKAQELLKKI